MFPDNGVKALSGPGGREDGVAAAEEEGNPGKDSAGLGGQRLAHGADELFEFEREVGAVSADRHRALTHGPGAGSGTRPVQPQRARARRRNRAGSPDVLETSANGVILAHSCEFV